MNTEQLAYYSRLNTGMKDFEIKRDGVGYWTPIHPSDPIYGHVRNPDGTPFEKTWVWTIKPAAYTIQEENKYNFYKLERHAFLKRTANSFNQSSN
jgi:hypothetical protein